MTRVTLPVDIDHVSSRKAAATMAVGFKGQFATSATTKFANVQRLLCILFTIIADCDAEWMPLILAANEYTMRIPLASLTGAERYRCTNKLAFKQGGEQLDKNEEFTTYFQQHDFGNDEHDRLG